MELYDKKYVYFEWDDELEGKKGFVATDILHIKKQVSECTDTMTELHHSSNNIKPFATKYYDSNYTFAYYDPNYEVKKAYNESEKLQWKYRDKEDWNDWDNDSCPTFFDDTTGYELRVKPDDCETDNYYFSNKGEIKSYSKDAEEFARKRVNYEMSYTDNMDFTDAQIEWIKDHIYISVRNAYQSAVDKWRNLQEMVSDTCHIMSGNKGNRTYRIGSKESEKDRHITNKELAMWLSQGKGQVQDRRTGRISTNYYYFEYDDAQIDYINIAVRKWEDDEWHEPTYNYCFGDK